MNWRLQVIGLGLLLLSAAPVDEGWVANHKGTVWIYRDNRNVYRKRLVEKIHHQDLKPLMEGVEGTASTDSQLFADYLEVSTLEGTRDEVQRYQGKAKTRAADFENSPEALFFLQTPRGILRARELDESGRAFWNNAFLYLPPNLVANFSWNTLVEGTRLEFKVDGGPKVISVPAGEFKNCWSIAYQYGLSETVFGSVDFCPGVGEVKIQEGTYFSELIEFRPTQEGALPAMLTPEVTERLWPLLAKEEEVTPNLSQRLLQTPVHKKILQDDIAQRLIALVTGFVSIFLVLAGWFFHRSVLPRS